MGYFYAIFENFSLKNRKSTVFFWLTLYRLPFSKFLTSLILVRPGVKFRDIGNVIQKHANANGYSVVKRYCGHGIHRLFHTAPNVPHYASTACCL